MNEIVSFVVIFGAFVGRQNEYIAGIICDLDWFLLPTKYQKYVMRIVHHCQHGITFKIGPLETHNLETGCEVCNSSLDAFSTALSISFGVLHFCFSCDFHGG